MPQLEIIEFHPAILPGIGEQALCLHCGRPIARRNINHFCGRCQRTGSLSKLKRIYAKELRALKARSVVWLGPPL